MLSYSQGHAFQCNLILSSIIKNFFSFLAGQCSPFGMAEDCERQSWVSGAVIALFSISHQQQGDLPHQCAS